jgi:hypothetical protein
VNLWIQVGKAYLSPVVEPADDPTILCDGDARLGDQGTVVEGWYATVPCANTACMPLLI